MFLKCLKLKENVNEFLFVVFKMYIFYIRHSIEFPFLKEKTYFERNIFINFIVKDNKDKFLSISLAQFER